MTQLCVPSPPVAMVRVLTTGDQGTRSSVRVQSLVPREAAMWVEEPTLLGEQRERLELALLHDTPSSPSSLGGGRGQGKRGKRRVYIHAFSLCEEVLAVCVSGDGERACYFCAILGVCSEKSNPELRPSLK